MELEIWELLQTIKTVVDVIDENTQDTEVIPQEVVDVLQSFGDSEQGNNDIEALLSDIKSSLMYDEDNTALYELSSRLEVIDTRLDLEFEVLNFGISVIGSVLLATVSIKFLSWIYRFISV